MDIVLGGSQKCISAPPGLTFLSISSDAKKSMKNRKTPIAGFYANLTVWDNWYEEKWFPYTQPISSIRALNCAIDRVLDSDSINRHKLLGKAVRNAVTDSGLKLYPKDSFSNSVTTILVPDGIDFEDIFENMISEHNIMIGGAFDYLSGKVIRIGNMGENCYEEKLYITLKALNFVLKDLGVKLDSNIHENFIKEI